MNMYAEDTKLALNTAIYKATMPVAIGRHQTGDMRDFSRKRILTPETVMQALMAFQGGSLKTELRDFGLDVTPSTFVQQRDKLDASAFRAVMMDFNKTSADAKTFRGYRVFAVDGTAHNIPYSPDSKYLITNASNPRGFCQMHLNLIYDLVNNLYIDCEETADEIGALIKMLYTNRWSGNSILILDRGYESYNVIAHLLNCQNLNFLLRVKQDKAAMRDIAKLPMMELDRDLTVTITTRQTNEDKRLERIFLYTGSKKGKTNAPGTRITRWDFPGPYTMDFRVVRVLLDTGEYETLVTDLPRSFTPDDIRELYHMRWGIETSFRNLKYTIGMTNIHAKKENSIFQEVYAALTMYNFCNRISSAAVIQANPNSKFTYKVDFKMATYLCREFYRTPGADGEQLLREIARYTVPVRPGRKDGRNIKAKSFAGFVYRVAA